MKFVYFMLLIGLFAQGESAGSSCRQPDPVITFQPSSYPGQGMIVKPKHPFLTLFLWFGLFAVIVIGLSVVGWIGLNPWWARALLILAGGALLVGGSILLFAALYAVPTERDRANLRHQRLTEALGLTETSWFGIADETYRFTILANRKTLVLVDYRQDTGFVIPRASIARLHEDTLTTGPPTELVTAGEFRGVSAPARRSLQTGGTASRIVIRLQSGYQPATVQILYLDRTFAPTFAEFVSSTLEKK